MRTNGILKWNYIISEGNLWNFFNELNPLQPPSFCCHQFLDSYFDFVKFAINRGKLQMPFRFNFGDKTLKFFLNKPGFSLSVWHVSINKIQGILLIARKGRKLKLNNSFTFQNSFAQRLCFYFEQAHTLPTANCYTSLVLRKISYVNKFMYLQNISGM